MQREVFKQDIVPVRDIMHVFAPLIMRNGTDRSSDSDECAKFRLGADLSEAAAAGSSTIGMYSVGRCAERRDAVDSGVPLLT